MSPRSMPPRSPVVPRVAKAYGTQLVSGRQDPRAGSRLLPGNRRSTADGLPANLCWMWDGHSSAARAASGRSRWASGTGGHDRQGQGKEQQPVPPRLSREGPLLVAARPPALLQPARNQNPLTPSCPPPRGEPPSPPHPPIPAARHPFARPPDRVKSVVREPTEADRTPNQGYSRRRKNVCNTRFWVGFMACDRRASMKGGPPL
jgi:hypothetical protein